MGEKKPKTMLTVADLRAFVEDMRSQATAVEGFIDRAEELGLDVIEVLNHASGLQGIDKLTKFTGAIYTAIAKRSLESTIAPAVADSVSAAKRVADEREKFAPERPSRKGGSKP